MSVSRCRIVLKFGFLCDFVFVCELVECVCEVLLLVWCDFEELVCIELVWVDLDWCDEVYCSVCVVVDLLL